MYSGSEVIETWIPDGGFRITRRRLQTPHHGIVVAECLVPKWENAELTAIRPCEVQPCLHHVFAHITADPHNIAKLASHYGLLTTAITRRAAPGEVVPARILPPEPIDIWRALVRELHACAGLWDMIRVGHGSLGARAELGARLTARLGANLARLRFALTARFVDDGRAPFQLLYRPSTLAGALWQRFAEEVAGLMCCVRCPAPKCGRWFLIGDAARNDKQYCSGACRSRTFREKARSASYPDASPGIRS